MQVEEMIGLRFKNLS